MTKEIDENMTFESYFYSFFLHGQLPFGEWSEHIKSWQKSNARVLFIRYENLFSDTKNELIKILRFCNLSLNEEKIDRSIKNSSFESMRKIEIGSPKLFNEERNLKKGYHFMRKGNVGDWHNYYSNDLLSLFMEKHKEIMNSLGYES
jgi:hypothetical protein